MKNIIFLSEKFPFLVVKFSIYLNRRVFVMQEQKSESLRLHMAAMWTAYEPSNRLRHQNGILTLRKHTYSNI